MFTTADFFQRPVLSIGDGKHWGNIVNFEFDKELKSLSHFVVGRGSDYYLASTAGIFKKENEAVMFTDTNFFSELGENAPFNPISLPIYGTSGEHTDIVQEVCFDEKFRVKELVGTQRRFLVKEIIAASPDALIIKDCKLPRKKSAQTQSKKTVKTKTDLPAVVLPNVITGNFSFLVGRRTDKTIFDRRNEVIIKKHAIITKETLRQARTNGKLLELSLHAIK